MSLAVVMQPAEDVQRQYRPLTEILRGDLALAPLLFGWRQARTDGFLPRTPAMPAIRSQADDAVLVHALIVHRYGPADFGFVAAEGFPPAIEKTFPSACLHLLEDGKCRRALVEDLTAAAISGVPSLHHVTARLAWRAEYYARLILPVAADGLRVDGLIVGLLPRPYRHARA